jgi:hypothetical protein
VFIMVRASTRRNGGRSFEGRGPSHSVFRDVLSLASTVIESGKHAGAEKIIAVAESTRAFGEDLDELPHLQAYAGAAADGLEDLADYIDRTEVADIFDDVAAFAKRQPVLAAAVTLAAGVAVAQAVRNWRTSPVAGGRRTTRRRRKANGRGRR